MTDFVNARRKMVESQLRTENVTDRRVLAAMGAVPREDFVPARLRPLAYIDRDFTLKEWNLNRPGNQTAKRTNWQKPRVSPDVHQICNWYRKESAYPI